MPIEIHFDHGTLVVPDLAAAPEAAQALVGSLLTEDKRTKRHRAPGYVYRDLMLGLVRAGIDYVDEARSFEPLDVELVRPILPFPHQREALEAWVTGGKRGIVELPTGAGKTLLAVLAIVKTKRPTLVVVPTIDLMTQWSEVLETHLGVEVGMLGGGVSERKDITVTTYDSAAFQTEFHGDQFGLLICDECHHLPAPAYRFIAEGSIAPFRLGLTATLERVDGGEKIAKRLLGDVVFSAPIDALEGEFLAPYEIRSVEVRLDEDEQAKYDEARQTYIEFLRKTGISFNRPSGWAEFIMRCHQSDEGRKAFAAYRVQRKIALTSKAKISALWEIILRHRKDRTIVFTEDNETVYNLSRLFFAPAITHQTKPKERKSWLKAFADGQVGVLLTSKVLNEGVDVPDANVGVVLSGNGSVREHVQRLGRILRKRPDKQAVLYEVFTDVAAEMGISERRRQHTAYARAQESEAEAEC